MGSHPIRRVSLSEERSGHRKRPPGCARAEEPPCKEAASGRPSATRRGRGLKRTRPCRHLDLGLPASRAARNGTSTARPSGPQCCVTAARPSRRIGPNKTVIPVSILRLIFPSSSCFVFLCKRLSPSNTPNMYLLYLLVVHLPNWNVHVTTVLTLLRP